MKLISDLPVDSSKDGLGFVDYGNALADAVDNTDGPLTVGVYGEWGSGKSSLMKMIEERLLTKVTNRDGEDKPRVATVWFNAWRYEREQHPIIPLISVMVQAVQAQKTFLENLEAGGEQLVSAFKAIAAGISVGSKQTDPTLSALEAGLTSGELKVDDFQSILDRSVYYNAYERLSSVAFPKNVKIVVLVDDLDRCFPDQAIALLESIKLVLSQPGFAFVLGVDRTILEGYLDHRYRVQYGIEDFSGSSYLDKIVQLPFYIPAHDGRIQEFSQALLSAIGLSSDSELAPVLETLIPACRNNPRTTIRMVNNLVVDRGISVSRHGEEQAVPVGLFAVTRALQQRWSQVYGTLVTSDELCLKVAEWAPVGPLSSPNFPPTTGSSGGSDIMANLVSSLKTDEDLTKLLFSVAGLQWLKDVEQRVAATTFIKDVRAEQQSGSSSARYDVFLSGLPESVRPFYDILKSHGVKVFWDQVGMHVGQDWSNVFTEALENSKLYCPLIEIKIANSQWSRHEWNLANQLSERKGGLRILPVLLEGEAPDRLARYASLDLRNKSDLERPQELAVAIRGMIG